MESDARAKEMSVRFKSAVDNGFKEWLGKPEVAALMSLVPAGDNKSEILHVLLRSAFSSGASTGEGIIMIEMVKNMLPSRKKE